MSDKFEILNGELKKYEGKAQEITIPSQVTSIADFAFYGCDSLEVVHFPDSVISIGSYAFYGCENLVSIFLPQSLQTLGGGAFAYCKKLLSITIPKGIKQIGKSTFYQCTHLENVLLPDDITELGHHAFSFCEHLKAIELPCSLVSIGEGAFEACLSLKKIILPDHVQRVGKKAFYRCTALNKFVASKQLSEVGESAFQTYSQLSFISNDTLFLKPRMFDDCGHINFSYGTKDKIGQNYQWKDSYLPHLDLSEWKEAAQIIILANFLETYDKYDESIKNKYSQACKTHKKALLDFLIEEKRYVPINQALTTEILHPTDLAPYFDRIHDREERAKLMEFSHQEQQKDVGLDDLESELMGLF